MTLTSPIANSPMMMILAQSMSTDGNLIGIWATISLPHKHSMSGSSGKLALLTSANTQDPRDRITENAKDTNITENIAMKFGYNAETSILGKTSRLMIIQSP